MSETIRYDAHQVKEGLRDRALELCEWLLPAGKLISGNWRVGDLQGSSGKSVSIPITGTRVGMFKDMATGETGTLIDLYMAVKGESHFAEAVDFLGGDFLKLTPTSRELGGVSHAPKESFTAVNPNDVPPPIKEGTAAWEYIRSRGIEEETIRHFEILQDAQGNLCLPHYDGDNIVLLKYWGAGKKIWSNKSPKHVLFGKQLVNLDECKGAIVVTEGQWDAMSYWQVGIPAVSIPSGVENTKWIEHDYNWLRQFHTIYLSFDQDDAGRKALAEAISRLDRDRCKVVDLPMKDANEMLSSGKGEELITAIEEAYTKDPDELVQATEYSERVHEMCLVDPSEWGWPFIIDMPFRVRLHESTVWTGYTGHGKSTAVEDQVCLLAAMGIMSCIASLETKPEMTLAKMVKKWTGDGDIGHKEYFNEAYEALADNVVVYDYMERCPVTEILKKFEYAHKRWGIQNFVLDNVMMLKIDRQDNEAQAEAANLLKEFVKKYPVHLHIVAHPRKPQGGEVPKAPSVHEIRGASEWCDIAYNVISVWRNTKKSKDRSMIESEGGMDVSQKLGELDNITCDGSITVGKQRSTGDLPEKMFWFDKLSMRYKNSFVEEVKPYWEKV